MNSVKKKVAKKTARKTVNRRRRTESSNMTKKSSIRSKMAPQKSESPQGLGDNVRIIPLGGVEEVGRNMTIVETRDDIFILDVGFQFVTESDTPGIDYILPNTKYLEARKKKIRAVFITHGHLDHIGGIPFVMPRIGNPPVYTRELTSYMIKKRQEEFPHLPKLDIKVVEPNEKLTLGSTGIEIFPVTHSIPDSMGVKIETPHGNIVITGDLKLDHVDGVPTKAEKDNFENLGKQNNLLLISDSTNAERPGFSITEREVHDNIDEIIKNVKGRIIIGVFASQFARMIKIIEAAEKYGKKVVLEGRSIRANLDIAIESGTLKPKKGTIISAEEIDNYPTDKILILATGAQGEEHAALNRIATKRHRTIRLKKTDTLVLSSSVIPGNEVSVQKLKDNLYRHDIKIINYRTSDVHSTGHGNSGELVWFQQTIKPKFFMPGYGFHSMLRNHAQAVMDAGFPRENIIIADNGSIIDILDGEKLHIHKEKAPSEMMMVDGTSIGVVQEAVINDRQLLSQDGIFVVIVTMDSRTGRVRKSPDIISRGFVYLKESRELLNETRKIARRTVENISSRGKISDFDKTKNAIRDKITKYLTQQTNKRPIVLPVIIEV